MYKYIITLELWSYNCESLKDVLHWFYWQKQISEFYAHFEDARQKFDSVLNSNLSFFQSSTILCKEFLTFFQILIFIHNYLPLQTLNFLE